jgi:cell division protein FtsB
MPRVQSEYEVETIFIDRLQEMNYEYVDLKNYDDVVNNFRKQLAKFNSEKLIEVNSRVTQNQEEYQKEYEKLVNEYEFTKAEHKKIESEISSRLAKTETIELFIKTINKQETLLTKFDEIMWGSLLECVKVYAADNIIFKFRDGTEIKG